MIINMAELPLTPSRGRFHHPAFFDSGTMLPTVAICLPRTFFFLRGPFESVSGKVP